MGPDDTQVAAILHEIGLSVQEAGRPGDAEALFEQVLKIEVAKLGTDDPRVAMKLNEIGLCGREARRLGDAEASLERVAKITEVKFGPDDPQVATALCNKRGAAGMRGGRGRRKSRLGER